MIAPRACLMRQPSPAYAGSHGCEAVEECAAGVLRSRAVAKAAMARRRPGEGGHASGLRSHIGYYGEVGSAGFAEETRGTTAVKPWGSTLISSPNRTTNS